MTAEEETKTVSMNRAAASTQEDVNGFYDKLENAVIKHGIQDKSHLWWNLDEAGFSYVTKPAKIVSQKGLKRCTNKPQQREVKQSLCFLLQMLLVLLDQV